MKVTDERFKRLEIERRQKISVVLNLGTQGIKERRERILIGFWSRTDGDA